MPGRSVVGAAAAASLPIATSLVATGAPLPASGSFAGTGFGGSFFGSLFERDPRDGRRLFGAGFGASLTTSLGGSTSLGASVTGAGAAEPEPAPSAGGWGRSGR